MTYFEKILKKYMDSKHGIREPKLPDVIPAPTRKGEQNKPTRQKTL